MSNKKSTKRALITSLFAVAVCVVMLIGTTFAWFTDTASTSVNKIQAGTLGIELQYEKSDGVWKPVTEDTVLAFKKAAAGEGQTILWEPGCTYELPALKVVNTGNLALKYKLQITGIKGDEKLNEAIEWTIDGATLDTDVSLEVGGSDEITIKGHMKEDAGNEYQGLSISGISITALATQDTVEYDSYNNTYDKDAPVYTVTPETVQDVLDSLKGYAIVQLTEGVYPELLLRTVKDKGNTEATLCENRNAQGELLGTYYTLYREINNLTIRGGEGVTVGTITHATPTVDHTIVINNLTIENVAFNDGDKNGFETTFKQVTVNGLTLKNCTMNVTCGTNAAKGNMLYTSTEASISNVKIEGCTVDGARRLASLTAVENLTISGNTIKNTTEHGILLADTINDGFKGNIVIKNNTASQLADRFLRADNFAATAIVTVKGNTIDGFGLTSKDTTSVKFTNTNGATVEIKDVPTDQYLIKEGN